MDNRRKSLIAIIFTFMIVTVPHVAIYAGSFEPPSSFWLGWPYSLAVEASIIVCAYFTKWQTTKVISWVGYFVFVVASGIMNVGYIQPETFPAWTYALFPTAAISLLGLLYRQVDKLVLIAEAGKRVSKQATETTGKLPEVSAPLPVELPEGLTRIPANLDDFRRMVEKGEALPERLTGDILAKFAHLSDRTGRNWLAAVRQNGHKSEP
jgi:hypothetical protein